MATKYYDEKAKVRTMRYHKKLKEIKIRIKPELYAVYQEAAVKQGYPSIRQFILSALDVAVKKSASGVKLE